VRGRGQQIWPMFLKVLQPEEIGTMSETPLAQAGETDRIIAKLPKLVAQAAGKLRSTRKRLSRRIQGSRNGAGGQRFERVTARAICESVCRSWQVNRDLARRESQRRLRLSVRPESSLLGKKTAADKTVPIEFARLRDDSIGMCCKSWHERTVRR